MMKNKISNVVWRLVLSLIGVGYAGGNLGVWDFNLFFQGWWTLFIIVPCFINLIQYGPNGGNIAGLCVGAALFLAAQGFLEFSLIRKLLVPAILVLVGISILLGNTKRRITDQQGNQIPYEKTGMGGSDVSGVFDGRKVHYDGQRFEGATVSAVFGGVDMDLRSAVIERDVRIDATAVFGGIGSIPGAVLGAFIIGIFENIIKAMGYTTFSDAFTFVLLILVLVVRPSGLFGEKTTEKV